MAIKIEMLRAFSEVAQTGNLAEAAARLGRTPAALSMTLKQLEEHLGQNLFEGERKNRLTPLGEQVFDLSRRQIRQFHETVQSIENSARSPKGLVRAASVPSVAALIFPSVIEKLAEKFPKLRFELRDTDSAQVIDALVNGHADIGIASLHQSLNGIRQEPLFSDRFGLICPINHPLSRALEDPTITQVGDAGYIHNLLCNNIESDSFQAATANPKLTVHNTQTLIAMVRSGGGVTVLPESVTNILPDELTFRRIADLDARRHLTLYTRENSPFADLIDEFALEISEAARKFRAG